MPSLVRKSKVDNPVPTVADLPPIPTGHRGFGTRAVDLDRLHNQGEGSGYGRPDPRTKTYGIGTVDFPPCTVITRTNTTL
jgi:hypothetical protein